MSGSAFPGKEWLDAAVAVFELFKSEKLYTSVLGGQGVYFLVVSPKSGDPEMSTWIGASQPLASKEHFDEALAFARDLIEMEPSEALAFKRDDMRGLKGEHHVIIVWGLRDKDLLEGFLLLLGLRMGEMTLKQVCEELKLLRNECFVPLSTMAEQILA